MKRNPSLWPQSAFALISSLVGEGHMLENILRRFRKQPGFYDELDRQRVHRYQHYLSLILSSVDIENNTKWSRGDRSLDLKRMGVDDQIMEEIIVGQAAAEGLKPVLLQIMVNQFFFAEPAQRDQDRTRWVQKVLNRKPADYFPDPWSLRRLMDASS